jgi:hypothetical protein
MTPHLRYLKYVLLHKLLVFRAGWMLRRQVECSRLRWLWRLLVHDWSKFTPAEWTPYVRTFYGGPSSLTDTGVKARAQATGFNRAWLHHIHANDHHWQHHILRQDNGTELTLIPPSWVIDEMIADWLGAGPKVLRRPTMAQAVAETIVWYAQNHARMQLRDVVRGRVETTLMELADRFGIKTAAQEIESTRRTRASIVIPGR